MATFSSRNRSTAVVPAPRQAIWDVLSDPAELSRLTPLVQDIRAEGDLWRWQLAGIRALGVCVAPTFPEHMEFDEPSHIGFDHDGATGAKGTYELRDAPDGATELAIDITISADLPLPKVAKRAVEKVMASSMARTGDRFARNLYRRLGLDPADAKVPAGT